MALRDGEFFLLFGMGRQPLVALDFTVLVTHLLFDGQGLPVELACRRKVFHVFS